ncbi:uncharacterized protein ACN2A1_014684 isoform 2-T3 [Glossina fuscipes fuscipes]
MYAAAGGASLASRQARQRQRQQKKTQQLQAKLHPPKGPGLSVTEHGASTPTRQSRQFHQLPTNYLRTPQAQVRKLSASYTAQSKLLLPIEEGDTQSVLHMRMHSHAHGQTPHSHSHSHGSQHHQHLAHYTGPSTTVHHHHGRVSPKLVHRYSGSSSGASFQHSHLPKSATATLPLVLQIEATPPKIRDEISDAAAEKQPLTAGGDSCDDEEHHHHHHHRHHHPPIGALERKCSVYRMKRYDAFDIESGGGVRRQLKELQFNQQHQQYEPLPSEEPHMVFKSFPSSAGRKVQMCAYCEEGICVCEHIECAQGRAAWLERGRRCSVQEAQHQTVSSKRWIQDASLGGSSDDEDLLGVLRGPSTFANAFLYAGLGTIALGLVIAFVGTGEKGFKTVELRLIGPSLIGLGFICCMLRILFCICPSHCLSSNKNSRQKNINKIDADHTTSLLHGESKRVSIARGPNQQARYPFTHKRSNTKMINEGMEALRQIATTSLFMQNEQKPLTNRIVPIIKEPENTNDTPLEMKKLNVLESKEDQINVNEADDIVRDLPILPDQSPRDSDVLNLRQSTNSTVPMISDNKYVGDLSSCSESNNSCKLLRQRVSINQTKMPEKALSQISPLTTPLISKDENPTECKYQMETSLMYLKNLKLENGVRSTLPENIVQTGSLMHSSLTPIHNALRNQTTKPAGTSATYAAALSAVNANRERNETLIRGPLGMPMHILTATSSTNTQTTSASILKYTTSSLIPAPPPTVPCSTNVCPLRVSSAHENIPGQITEVTKQVNLVSGSALTLGTQANNVAFPSSSAATVTATYSDNLSSRNIPLNIFTGSTTAPTIKCEPELLLSPAKLGQ